MKFLQMLVVLSVAIGTEANASVVGEGIEELLIGNWACESGVCSDEEISFSIDDGIRSYNSWLHERPSAANGTWIIDKEHLTIECCAGLTYEYTVVRVTDAELVLRDTETAEETVLSRIKSADVPPNQPMEQTP